jgi:hypothetical protein
MDVKNPVLAGNYQLDFGWKVERCLQNCQTVGFPA